MKVFIGLPIFNLIDPRVMESQQKMFESTRHEITICRIVGANVEHARQILMKKFLETDFDYFFCVDADNFVIESPYEDVIDRLISLKQDIIGGVYVYKKKPCLPVFRPIELQEIYEKTGKFPEKYKFVIPDEPFEVTWIGGGFKMVKREVCEVLQKKYKFPNLPMEYKGEYVSEDWAFDQRARECGFSVWADPKIKLGHQGNFIFTIENYFENLNK